MKNVIGIIGAMESEVAGLISKLKGHSVETVGGVEFHTGTLFSRDVVISRCGVGKVFAAICAEAMIIKYSPCLIVNTGVGGALASNLKCTDTVIATSLVQYDMDTSPLGDPKGMISGINRVFFDADKRAVRTLLDCAGELGIYATEGIVASGDRFVSDKATKDMIVNEFGASVCEMEGAAIAHVAFVNGTPFAVVRAISDNADGESAMSFSSFVEIAAKNSEALTLALLRSY